jgi:hypothetical protein
MANNDKQFNGRFGISAGTTKISVVNDSALLDLGATSGTHKFNTDKLTIDAGTGNFVTKGTGTFGSGGNGTVNSAGTGGVYQIGGTNVLTSSVVLGLATGITVGGTTTTTITLGKNTTELSTTTIGGAITGNVLTINGTISGTTYLQSAVTTGTQHLFNGLTTGTLSIGSAAAGYATVLFNKNNTLGTTDGSLVTGGGLGVTGNATIGSNLRVTGGTITLNTAPTISAVTATSNVSLFTTTARTGGTSTTDGILTIGSTTTNLKLASIAANTTVIGTNANGFLVAKSTTGTGNPVLTTNPILTEPSMNTIYSDGVSSTTNLWEKWWNGTSAANMTSGSINIGNGLTTGSITLASNLTTGTINIANGTGALGTSSTTTAVNILSGAMTGTTSTRTLNLATSGGGGVTSNVNIGSTNLGTTKIQSPTTSITSTDIDLGDAATDNISLNGSIDTNIIFKTGAARQISIATPEVTSNGHELTIKASDAFTDGAGGNVTISAGGAAGTNQNGGILKLNSGAATGTGSSSIEIGTSNTKAITLGNSSNATETTINGQVNVYGTTLTTSNPILTLSQTWNAAATNFDAIYLDVTNTASNSSSNLLRLRTTSVDKFVVDKNGLLTVGDIPRLYARQDNTTAYLPNNANFTNPGIYFDYKDANRSGLNVAGVEGSSYTGLVGILTLKPLSGVSPTLGQVSQLAMSTNGNLWLRRNKDSANWEDGALGVTGTLSGTNTVTVASTAGYQVGMQLINVSGAALGAGAAIASITSGTTFTTTVNHVGSGGSTFNIMFSPWRKILTEPLNSSMNIGSTLRTYGSGNALSIDSEYTEIGSSGIAAWIDTNKTGSGVTNTFSIRYGGVGQLDFNGSAITASTVLKLPAATTTMASLFIASTTNAPYQSTPGANPPTTATYTNGEIWRETNLIKYAGGSLATDVKTFALMDNNGLLSPTSISTTNLSITGGLAANSWTTNGIGLKLAGSTYTNNSTAASTTLATTAIHSIAAPTIASTNTDIIYTNAASLYIAGGPIGGTNSTITNSISLWAEDLVVFPDTTRHGECSDITSKANTFTTATGTLLDLPVSKYGSVEYTIQVKRSTARKITKILALYNGSSDVDYHEYGTINIGTWTSEPTLTVSYKSTAPASIRLEFTGAGTTSTEYKVTAIATLI